MPDRVLRTAVSQPASRPPLGGGPIAPFRRRHPIAPNVTYPLCMHAPGRPRARRPWLPIVGAALAVAAGVRGRRVAALGRRRRHPPRRAGCRIRRQPSRRRRSLLPEHPRVLIFGDSWVYGSAAIVPTLGFAYVVGETAGWDTVVDGVRGSGYLKPGIDGGTYGERIAALDSGARPRPRHRRGIHQRPAPARGGIPGCRDRRLGCARALYPDAQVRHPRPVAAGAAGRIRDRPHRRGSGGTRRAPRLVVRLADRRRVDHPRQLPRCHRHRHRPQPPVDRGPRLPRRPARAQALATLAEGADVVADAPSTRSSSVPDRGRQRPRRGW